MIADATADLKPLQEELLKQTFEFERLLSDDLEGKFTEILTTVKDKDQKAMFLYAEGIEHGGMEVGGYLLKNLETMVTEINLKQSVLWGFSKMMDVIP